MSDLKIENMGLIETYPTAQWYDYTKNPIRMKKFIAGKFPPNYHLTFSLGSSNKSDAKEILKLGGNIAAVFRAHLPKSFNGYKVINADESDLRFLDGNNIIAGLKIPYDQLLYEWAPAPRKGSDPSKAPWIHIGLRQPTTLKVRGDAQSFYRDAPFGKLGQFDQMPGLRG